MHLTARSSLLCAQLELSSFVRPFMDEHSFAFLLFEYEIEHLCVETMLRRRNSHESLLHARLPRSFCSAQLNVSDQQMTAFLCSALRKGAYDGLVRACMDRLLGYDFFNEEVAAIPRRTLHSDREERVLRVHSAGVLIIGAHHDINCKIRRCRVHFSVKSGKITKVSQVQHAVLQHLQLPHEWRAIGNPVSIRRVESEHRKSTDAHMPVRSSTGNAPLHHRSRAGRGAQSQAQYKDGTFPDLRAGETREPFDLEPEYRSFATCPRLFLQRMAHVDGSQAVISMYLRWCAPQLTVHQLLLD